MISSNEIRPPTAGTVLHVTRQSFYYERRQTARRLRVDESEKRKLILELAGENITYGYRRIRALLRRQGVFISRNRVRRIMGEMHLLREAHFHRPRLPQTGNLISDVPDVRWYTDISAPRRKWFRIDFIKAGIKRPIVVPEWEVSFAPFPCSIEDGGGPPEPPCRWRFQTTVSCCAQRPWW